MKRKLLTVIIVLSTIMTLAGCGNEKKSSLVLDFSQNDAQYIADLLGGSTKSETIYNLCSSDYIKCNTDKRNNILIEVKSKTLNNITVLPQFRTIFKTVNLTMDSKIDFDNYNPISIEDISFNDTVHFESIKVESIRYINGKPYLLLNIKIKSDQLVLDKNNFINISYEINLSKKDKLENDKQDKIKNVTTILDLNSKHIKDLVMILNDNNILVPNHELPILDIELPSIDEDLINHAPIIKSILEETMVTGEVTHIMIQAQDEDKDPLTYSVFGPKFMHLEDNMLTFKPAHDQVGTYTVLLTVTDGHLASSIEFKVNVVMNGSEINPPLNTAPIVEPIKPVSFEWNKDYLVKVVAQDNEGEPLTFSLMANEIATIDASTGNIRFSANQEQIGDYQLTVMVSDGSLTSTIDFLVTIKPLAWVPIEPDTINNAPIIVPIVKQEVLVGKMHKIIVHASDQEQDPLTYLVEGASFARFEENVLVLFPARDQAGIYTLVVTVSDGVLSNSVKFEVEVNEKISIGPPPNLPPVIEPITSVSFEWDKSQPIQVEAHDKDGDKLIFSLSQNKIAMIDAQTGIIEFITNITHVGIHVLTVTVSDGVSASSMQLSVVVKDLSWTPVEPDMINHAPVVQLISDKILTFDHSLVMELQASDKDQDALTFLVSGVDFVELDKNILTIKPTQEHVGSHVVMVVVSDGYLTASTKFKITVLSQPEIVDRPPLVKKVVLPIQYVNRPMLPFQIEASDPEEQQLFFQLKNAPGWMKLSEKGLLEGTPNATIHTNMLLVVSDGQNDVVQEISIKVLDENNIEPIINIDESILDKNKITYNITDEALNSAIIFENIHYFDNPDGSGKKQVKRYYKRDMDNGEIEVIFFIRNYHILGNKLANKFTDKVIFKTTLSGFKKFSEWEFVFERTFRLSSEKGMGTAWVVDGADTNNNGKIDKVIMATNTHVISEVYYDIKRGNSSLNDNYASLIHFFQNKNKKIITELNETDLKILYDYSSFYNTGHQDELFITPYDFSKYSYRLFKIGLDLTLFELTIDESIDSEKFEFINQRPPRYRIINDFDLENSTRVRTYWDYPRVDEPSFKAVYFSSGFLGYPYSDTLNGKHKDDTRNKETDFAIYYPPSKNKMDIGIVDKYSYYNSWGRQETTFTFDAEGYLFFGQTQGHEVIQGGTSGSALFDENMNVIGIHYSGYGYRSGENLFGTNFTKHPGVAGGNEGFSDKPKITNYTLMNYNYIDSSSSRLSFKNVVKDKLGKSLIVVSPLNKNN
ncbi:DUF31 family putative serine protease [Vibrio harveyi]